MTRLVDKVAVIVGGARGIGLATVHEFLAEGAVVYACDLRPAAEKITHPRYPHRIVDATDESQVTSFIQAVLAAEDGIDCCSAMWASTSGNESTPPPTNSTRSSQ